MKQLTAISLALLLCGCARFSTKQTDERTNEQTGEKTKVTTKASATTFAASKSALAQWKASQTDKQQGAEVGSLEQESDASKLLDAVVQAAVKAGAATVKP
jgi:hypothetical protein